MIFFDIFEGKRDGQPIAIVPLLGNCERSGLDLIERVAMEAMTEIASMVIRTNNEGFFIAFASLDKAVRRREPGVLNQRRLEELGFVEDWRDNGFLSALLFANFPPNANGEQEVVLMRMLFNNLGVPVSPLDGES